MRNQHAFEETQETVVLTVATNCPEKWLLVDRETGQVFQGSVAGHWDRLDPVRKDKNEN